MAEETGKKPTSFTYTIKKGDTLEGISQQFGTTIYDIAKNNKIKNPNKIWEGRPLVIPYKESQNIEQPKPKPFQFPKTSSTVDTSKLEASPERQAVKQQVAEARSIDIPQVPEDNPDDWVPAMFLPMSINKNTGERKFAVPGILQNYATLPHDVVFDDLDPNSEEGFQKAMMWAGTVMGGGFAGTGASAKMALTDTQEAFLIKRQAKAAKLIRQGRASGEEFDDLGFQTNVPEKEFQLNTGFGGARSKTADLKQLEIARELEGKANSARDVWEATGWFRGKDGKWRSEIPNEKLTIKDRSDEEWGMIKELSKKGVVQLKGILDWPELYEAYPIIAKAKVVFDENVKGSASYQWNPEGGIISLKPDAHKNLGEMVNSLQHEIQHGIQRIEGFSSGSSKSSIVKQTYLALDKVFMEATRKGDTNRADAAITALKDLVNRVRDPRLEKELKKLQGKMYWREAGEVEARNAADRYTYKDKYEFPVDSEDVARELQILKD